MVKGENSGIEIVTTTTDCIARLAQSVEHQTFNLRVMGSSPISGATILRLLSKQLKTTFTGTILHNTV